MAVVTLNAIKNKQRNPENNKKRKLTNKQRQKTNYQEILNPIKLETNRRQTVDKVGTEPETNRRQSVDKVETESDINCRQSVDKVGTEPETRKETNRRQSVDKVETIFSFSSLVGNQRKIVFFIYNQCRQTASIVSPPITLEHLSKSCQIPINSMKKTIQRLKEKNIIIRSSSKSGRGGWTQYKLVQPVYSELLNLETIDKLETKCRQSVDKVGTEQGTELETIVPSSSSSNINNKTTTTKLPQDWLGIQIPRNLKDLGFIASHIWQIHKNGTLKAQEVQDSLNAFAYDLENGKVKARNGSLNLLMGVLLKKGMYISEGYLTESKKEIDAYLAKIEGLETAKKKLKEVNKQKQFEKWLETISDERKNQIIPPNDLVKTGGPFQLAMLKGYWEKEIEGRDNIEEATQI